MNESTENRPPVWALVLAFAAVYVIWGSTYLAIRVAVQSVPPLLLAGSRFVLAGTLLYGFSRAFGARAPTRKEWFHAGVTGTFMATLGNGLVTLAEEHIPSNLAALLIACVPLYVALIDWALPFGTRPTKGVLAGVVLGLFGMVLLVAPEPGQTKATDLWGVVALLGAGLAWAVGSLYARYQPRHPNAVLSSGQQMLVGGAVLCVGALLRGEVRPQVLTAVRPEALWAFAYLTLGGSIIAFSAFTWLIGVSSPTRVSTTAYVNPLVAVILGWWLLGETLTARATWGALSILGAVALMSLTSKRARDAASRHFLHSRNSSSSTQRS